MRGPRKGFRVGRKLSKAELAKRKRNVLKQLAMEPKVKVYIETQATPAVKAFLDLYYLQIHGRLPPGMEKVNEALRTVEAEIPSTE